MKDEEKNREELLAELLSLRQKIAEMEGMEKDPKRIEDKLRQRERLLAAAAKATNCLVTFGHEHAPIIKALEILGFSADADRVSIFENHRDPVSGKLFTSQRYEWARGCVEAQIDNPALQNMACEDIFPDWCTTMAEGKPVNEIVRHLSLAMKEILDPQGILSILIVPVIIEGYFWGSIGFDDCHSERLWEDSEVDILSAVAGSIGVALIRKRSEEDKEKMQIQLRQSQKMETIGTLAGGIAHDFNNILSAILGFTEITLCHMSKKNTNRQRLEQVLKAGNRAKELVKQILAFSRQSDQERIPLQVSRIVKESLNLLRALLPVTIEIKKYIHSDTGIILADPIQIHQIMMNLCTNAEHSMREKGGVLEIRLEEVELNADTVAKHLNLKAGSYLKLTVSDTGTGMDDKTLERIFDPFFTTKKQGEGTGMGLSVVYGIVKSHGGAISVKSSCGKGTTFDIFFPRLAGDIVPASESEVPLVRGKGRILFVDDEEDLVLLQQQMLGYLGYEVVGQSSSIQANEVFSINPDYFDMVITDYTMPHMTGLEIAKKFLQLRTDIPIILCTGYSEVLSIEMARNIGIREILMKPISFRELADTVQKYSRNQETL